MNAIGQARKLYEDRGMDFMDVLMEHHNEGIVLSSPLWFLMLKLTKLDTGEATWYVECAIGDMREMIKVVALKLPFITFSRVKNNVISRRKIYQTDRLVRLVER